MYMQFTLEGFKSVEPSLIKILQEDLPIRMSYQLSKLYDVVVKEMEKVETLRQALVKRYGKEEEGGTVKVTEENIPDFNKEFIELMQQPVDGGSFDAIAIDDIIKYSERLETLGKSAITLSANDIQQLKLVGVLKEGE